jgi:hypothetical protein
MKFRFQIVRLGTHNKRCQIYTIVKDGEDVSEAVKFLENPMNRASSDYTRLKTRLVKMKDRVGARIGFFKPEGYQHDLVNAFVASKKKRGYLDTNDLRWYCIRVSENCVVLGNGGVKHVGKTQEDKHLMEKERDMRWVDQCIDAAFRNEELSTDNKGNLEGTLEYDSDFIEHYGLQ